MKKFLKSEAREIQGLLFWEKVRMLLLKQASKNLVALSLQLGCSFERSFQSSTNKFFGIKTSCEI